MGRFPLKGEFMSDRAKYYRKIREQGWSRATARILASETSEADLPIAVELFESGFGRYEAGMGES